MSEPVVTVAPVAAEPVSASPEAATTVAAPVAAAPHQEPPFSDEEIKELDADDGDAGRSIGKMLASFFLYTVIVMLIVAWWTVTRH